MGQCTRFFARLSAKTLQNLQHERPITRITGAVVFDSKRQDLIAIASDVRTFAVVDSIFPPEAIGERIESHGAAYAKSLRLFKNRVVRHERRTRATFHRVVRTADEVDRTVLGGGSAARYTPLAGLHDVL